jgi:hypothetical protein
MQQRNSRLWRRTFSALLSVVVVAGALAGWAGAASKPPKPGASAVSQYVEMLPTGSGSVAAGTKGSSPAPLPPTARQALLSVGGQTAAALKTVATSPAYGAPAHTTNHKSKPAADRSRHKPAPSLAGALSSVAETSNASGNGQVILLLFLLPLTAVAMLAARALRQRSPSG